MESSLGGSFGGFLRGDGHEQDDRPFAGDDEDDVRHGTDGSARRRRNHDRGTNRDEDDDDDNDDGRDGDDNQRSDDEGRRQRSNSDRHPRRAGDGLRVKEKEVRAHQEQQRRDRGGHRDADRDHDRSSSRGSRNRSHSGGGGGKHRKRPSMAPPPPPPQLIASTYDPGSAASFSAVTRPPGASSTATARLPTLQEKKAPSSGRLSPRAAGNQRANERRSPSSDSSSGEDDETGKVDGGPPPAPLDAEYGSRDDNLNEDTKVYRRSEKKRFDAVTASGSARATAHAARTEPVVSVTGLLLCRGPASVQTLYHLQTYTDHDGGLWGPAHVLYNVEGKLPPDRVPTATEVIRFGVQSRLIIGVDLYAFALDAGRRRPFAKHTFHLQSGPQPPKGYVMTESTGRDAPADRAADPPIAREWSALKDPGKTEGAHDQLFLHLVVGYPPGQLAPADVQEGPGATVPFGSVGDASRRELPGAGRSTEGLRGLVYWWAEVRVTDLS